MRILHIITRLIIGGAQENTLATVKGLRRQTAWTVRLIAGPTRGPEGSLEPLARAEPDLFKLEPFLVRPINPIFDILALVRLYNHIRRFRPTIVHTHSGKAGFLGRFAAWLARVPLIVHTIHGPSFGPFQGFLANKVYLSAERIAAKWTTHFVVVANAMKELYLKSGIGTPSKYTRIFSGFDLAPYKAIYETTHLRRSIGIPLNAFVIAKLARLFPLKGHEDLIAIAPELARRLPNVHFLLIGDGPLRNRLQSMVADMRLSDRFHFVGLVPPEGVPQYLAAADVLVHLSYREGLPRALPQALALGIPVIAWDCFGAAEVCLEGQTGFLVPPGDRSLLLERLLTLASNPKLREEFGLRGQALVSEWFDERHMVDQIIRLYKQLAQKLASTSPDDPLAQAIRSDQI